MSSICVPFTLARQLLVCFLGVLSPCEEEVFFLYFNFLIFLYFRKFIIGDLGELEGLIRVSRVEVNSGHFPLNPWSFALHSS